MREKKAVILDNKQDKHFFDDAKRADFTKPID